MAASYEVRMFALLPRKNAAGTVTSYGVRWQIGGERFYRSFKVRAGAEGFRSDLISAQRKGERFDLGTGLPVSMGQPKRDVTWFELTTKYMDMKWPDLAATARQTVAESLIRVMPVFVPDEKRAPGAKVVRSAFRQWGYNTAMRANREVPDDVRTVLDWCAKHTHSVETVVEPDTLRALQRAVTRRLDGQPYAPTVARKTRSVLWNVLDYAVEQRLIDTNPLIGVKWTAMPKGKRKIDKRAVPNPIQARTLLAAVGQLPRSGPQLVAYFGTMYYSALRPEEAAALGERHVDIPEPTWDAASGKHVYGWGKFHLDVVMGPEASGQWLGG